MSDLIQRLRGKKREYALVKGDRHYRDRLANELEREAADELERLRAALSGDAVLAGMHVEGHGIDLGIQHPLVNVMADALCKMVGDSNYVEMRLKHKDTGDEYLVHAQRLARPTPHELRQRAEAELERIAAEGCGG